MMQKKLKIYWNLGIGVLIWGYSARAFQWLPTWQGLDDFQKSLLTCALDESSLSIGRFKQALFIHKPLAGCYAYAAGGQFGQYIMMQKTWKMTGTLANGYSSDSTQQELSNEYQYDRV